MSREDFAGVNSRRAISARGSAWGALWVFVVLVVEHHHRHQAPAVSLIVNQLSPTIVSHAHAAHEAASPVVAVRRTILIFQ